MGASRLGGCSGVLKDLLFSPVLGEMIHTQTRLKPQLKFILALEQHFFGAEICCMTFFSTPFDSNPSSRTMPETVLLGEKS